ncbi:MAG: hypothetical protein ABW360_02615 [Phenylobacterium sp.]
MTTTEAAKTPSKTPAPRVAYLVLGMHRSGTSAVTQLLALAGAHLPENVMPGDEHNAKGYFEPWKVALLNDERLRDAGAAWDDVFAFPFRPLSRKAERVWLNRAEALFEEEFGGARHPLLKDPRVTVLLPFWRTVLDDLEVAARCVIPVRHPLAVAGSLERRNGFAPEKSVLLWTAYMLAAEAYTRDLPRAFVGYDALLADWRGEVARMESAHGAKLPKLTQKAGEAIDQFLSPDLRHNDDAGDLSALGWAGELTASVYAWFQAAARGEAPDRAPLDLAARDLARRRDEVGVLVSPVTRDLDQVRAELHEVRQRFEIESAELRHAANRDRTVLEQGWRADVERLEGQHRELQAQMAAERQQLEKGWRSDVARLATERRKMEAEVTAERQRLEAHRRELEAEIEQLRQNWAEVGVRLDSILADG